nr:MAG TPA: hypothetical protein [Caudoviricetes sp.]
MKPTAEEIEEAVKERLKCLEEEVAQSKAEMKRSLKKYALIAIAGGAMCIAAITGLVQGIRTEDHAEPDMYRVYVEHGGQVDKYLAYDVERIDKSSANLSLISGIKIKVSKADEIIVLTYDYQKVEGDAK